VVRDRRKRTPARETAFRFRGRLHHCGVSCIFLARPGEHTPPPPQASPKKKRPLGTKSPCPRSGPANARQKKTKLFQCHLDEYHGRQPRPPPDEAFASRPTHALGQETADAAAGLPRLSPLPRTTYPPNARSSTSVVRCLVAASNFASRDAARRAQSLCSS
jgi:hypothetical protein